MAVALAEAGANLVLPDVKGDLAEQAAERIRSLGRDALALELDVADPLGVERCFAAAVDHFGRLDILINNAGTAVLGASVEATQAEWQRVFDVNVSGLFYCCQQAGRIMLRQGRGKILKIASIYCLVWVDRRRLIPAPPITPPAAADNASKGAVVSP